MVLVVAGRVLERVFCSSYPETHSGHAGLNAAHLLHISSQLSCHSFYQYNVTAQGLHTSHDSASGVLVTNIAYRHLPLGMACHGKRQFIQRMAVPSPCRTAWKPAICTDFCSISTVCLHTDKIPEKLHVLLFSKQLKSKTVCTPTALAMEQHCASCNSV